MKFRRTFKVETVQNMGSDEMIARAARVSTGKDLLEQDKIEGLIDHQQAAYWAIAAALHGDACPDDPDPGESCGCGDYEREATTALTAATPHLRAAWEQEMARAVKRLPWNGVTHGGTMVPLDAVLALLEGGGACCEHSKCPGGSICCCQEGGAE